MVGGWSGVERGWSPAHLHGVVGVLVVEDEGLLDELVVSLQLIDVGLVVDDVLLVLLQAVHLLLQGAGDVHRHMADLLQGAHRSRAGQKQKPNRTQGCSLTEPRLQQHLHSVLKLEYLCKKKEKKRKNMKYYKVLLYSSKVRMYFSIRAKCFSTIEAIIIVRQQSGLN